ncbi:hypothetical protein V8G54_031818 [Vigna mungo]|uniref:Uncharacterized protein n=1 Tax=Vigna mungo TaxID=3915 RepID=A0AAQ3MKU9_VIGMU
MLKVARLESAKLPYYVFISKILVHFGVNCIGESSESYSRISMINKSTLHKMGMQHTPDGWQFKNEVAEEDEKARQSSSIPYRAHSEFERNLLREIISLKIICQGTRDDVTKMKEQLLFQNRNGEEENEDDSGEEGSTPIETTAMEEEESEDDDVAEESNKRAILQKEEKSSKNQEVTVVIISFRFLEERGCCVFKEEEREGFLTVRGVSKGLDNRRGDSCCCSSYCIVYILIRGLVVKTLIIIVHLLPVVGRTLDVGRLAEPV